MSNKDESLRELGAVGAVMTESKSVDEAQLLLAEGKSASLSPTTTSVRDRESPLARYVEFYAIAFLMDAGVFLLWPVFDTNVTKQFPVGQNFVYCTQWNGTIQTVYLGVCLFEALFMDTVRWVRVYVAPWRHRIYASVAFPLCNLVSIIFFTLILDFGSGFLMVFRRVFSHAGVFIIIWTDTYLVRHKYKGHGFLTPDKAKKRALIQSAYPVTVGLIYLIWNLITHAFNHVYPYAFQEKLTAVTATIAYIGLLLLLWSLYWLGRWVNQKLHASQQIEAPATSPKQDYI